MTERLPARSTLRDEVLLVLGVSLGASAVYSLVSIIGLAHRPDRAGRSAGHPQRLGRAGPALAPT